MPSQGTPGLRELIHFPYFNIYIFFNLGWGDKLGNLLL